MSRTATLLCLLSAVAAGATLLTATPALAAPPAPQDTTATPGTASTSTVTTLWSGPVRVQRGAEWVPVDLTLAAGPDGTVRPVSAPQDLTLTSTGPSVRFTDGGSAAVPWPTPLPAPRLDGPTATYPQAAPGYDLVVEATRAGFVASVRRDGTPPAPAPQLVLQRTAATHQAMTEAESSVDRVVAAAPPTSTAPVPFDTTTQTTIRTTDSSGDPDLRIGSYDGTQAARSYLAFDLTPLGSAPAAAPMTAPINRATLDLYQTWTASCRPTAWEVWSLPAGSRVGPALRWANQPSGEKRWATSTDTRGNPAGGAACAAGWSSVDVTDLVQAWTAAGATSGTVMLKAADETDPQSWKRFASAETATVPHLTVTRG
ncbi:hypothetical protein GCM10009836_09330 [Pseudonocardia ailaonensis]|uniref:Carbohydrate-binding module family 96 domain-containing protein n=1 Tax=Pseudonocardia ailaonensis TaxID=367279 RepID=A0ABN2MNG9_9PSEU